MIKKTVITTLSVYFVILFVTQCTCSPKVVNTEPLFHPFSGICDEGYSDAEGMNVACIPDSWIVKKISFKELNDNYFTEKNRKRWLRHPEQYGNKFWLEVDNLINEDGNLLLFDSPKEYWEGLAGRSGWAIEKNG
jgi:hypothetical protein